MKKTIKIEELFKQIERFANSAFSSRFRIYKFIASNIKLTVIFVIIGATGAFAAGYVYNEITTEYVEMLVHTSDNLPSKLPRAQWTNELVLEERAASAKQGYIERVEPEGFEWGELELDPKRYLIVTIKKEDFKTKWLESSYDLSRPFYTTKEADGEKVSEISGYEVDLMRKFRLPLESILAEAKLADLRAIPYNDPTQRPAIRQTVKKGIADLVIENDYYTNLNVKELKLHGSSGFRTMCPSGCHYTTIDTFINTEAADLTGTGPSILEIRGVWTQPEARTAVTIINGWTTTASDYIYIYAVGKARHQGKWSQTAYRLEFSNTIGFFINEDFVRVEALQLRALSNSANDQSLFYAHIGINASNDIRLSHSILRGSKSATYNLNLVKLNDADIKMKMWNNLLYDAPTTTFSANIGGLLSFSYFYNNTIYNNFGGFWGFAFSNDSVGNLKNNLVYMPGSGNDDYDNIYLATSTTNVSSDTSVANSATDRINQTPIFVDAADGDFRLAINDTAAKDYGTDLSSDYPLAFSDDILGNPRTGAWDIGAFEVVDQLVGQWKFDEGYASTTYDSAIAKNNGTLQNNTSWVMGKFNRALSFDGGNDYVSVSDNAALEFATSTGLTVSAWIKTATSTPTNRQYIVTKASATQGGYKLYMGAAGDLAFGVDDDSTWNPDDMASTTETDYADNVWHNVVGVKTHGATEIRLYVDGVKKATDSSLAAASSLQNTGNFYIGIDRDGASFPFDGVIDDVRLYNYPLTDNQITGLFNSGSAREPANIAVGASQNNPIGGPGDVTEHLVGYWDFDETATGVATERTGLAKNGADSNTAVFANGQFAYARDFNGTTAYVDVGDITQTVRAASFWINADSNTGDIIDFDGGAHSVEISSGVITATGFSKPILYLNGIRRDRTVTTNVWHQLAAVTQTGFSASNLQIGTETSFFDGRIDEVKIFNAALSDDQILANYVSGPGPRGFWRFEEGLNQTVNDLSGYENNGYLGASSATGADDPRWTAIGAVGNALDFDGVDDEVQVGTKGWLDIISDLTVTAWIKPDTFGQSNYGRIYDRNNDTISFYMNNNPTGSPAGTQTLSSNVTNQQGSGNNNIITLGTWQHVAMIFSDSKNLVSFFVNGVAGGSYVNTGTLSSPGAVTARIGNRSDQLREFDGMIDEVKVYSYDLTMRQLAFDYSGGSPISYWKFDEGYASTTYDASGGGRNGSLIDNTTWTLNGAFARALAFDGVNDYVSIADSVALDFAAAEEFSVMLWTKHTGTISSTMDYLLTKADATNGGYKLVMDDNGLFAFAVDDDSAWTPDDVASSTARFDDSAWHHVAGVKWGTDRIELFVDGQKVSADTAIAATATLANSGTLNIGIDSDGASRAWEGLLDEVKLYTYARTPAEIRQDYTAGGSARGRGAALRAAAVKNAGSVWDDGGFGGAAPVGWWRFEEQIGTTAYDISGNFNNGNLTNAPTWSSLGMVGGALSFDGSNDLVNVGSREVLDNLPALTISTWLYGKSYGQDTQGFILSKDGGGAGWWDFMYLDTGDVLRFIVDFSITDLDVRTSGLASTFNTWMHWTLTWDGSASAQNVHIYKNGVEVSYSTQINGSDSRVNDAAQSVVIGNYTGANRTFDGLIDEVKIYNYVRSQAQIAFDYDGGKPVGWWKFDEGEGSIAYDSSGNNKNGTLNPGSGGTTTATSSMWVTSGRINSALDFDGTDDYVNIGNVSASISTASLWIKADALNSDIIDFDSGTHSIEMNASGAITATGWSSPAIYINGSDTASFPAAITTGNWYHVTVTTATAFNVTALQLGTETSFLNGKLDDIRIYTYARSADQVKQDYNSGAAVRF